MRGKPFERSAGRRLPYVGHVQPGVVLLDDGSLLAVLALRGLPHELASISERESAARVLNAVWRNVAGDTVTLGAHFVRHKHVTDLPPAAFSNRFAADLDRVYRERVLGGQLFNNQWFLSIVVAPSNPLVGTSRGRELNRLIEGWRNRKAAPSLRPDLLAELERLCTTIEKSLEHYEIRRLGLREKPGVPIPFSEIGEALRLILYAEPLPVPLVSGRLGHAIYTDRVIFGHWYADAVGLPQGCPRWAFEVQHPSGSHFGAIFGLREYMPRTWCGILDAVLSLPFPVGLNQSFGFLSRPGAISALNLKANQMRAGGDKAADQIEELSGSPHNADGSPRPNAQNRLMNGEFAMGVHHLSLAIYANRLEELESAAGIARARLADAGAVVVPETLGMESAYFAQLPGNLDDRTRPGAISSKNFAHLADYGAFPMGQTGGHWGAPMVRFKTTAGTPYDCVPHVRDVGMMAVFGTITSGKSTFLMFWLAMVGQYFVEREGFAVLLDKDRGGEMFVRSCGGIYNVVLAGEYTGWAPLRGLSNTPADRQFLARWIKGLILLDGQGPISAEDDAGLARGVTGIMRLPVELRSFDGMRQFMGGWRHPQSAGARLERWYRDLGWMFNGKADNVSFDAKLVGFDLTSILGYPELVTPAAQYLLYRIRSIMDGRRICVCLDEARAYLLHELFRADTQAFILEARKNNVAVVLVTQEPQHLADGAFGSTMIDQCHTKLFMRNPVADPDVYIDKLHLTEGEFAAIREKMLPGSRQCLITRRDEGSVIIDFDLSAMPEYVAVLSGRATSVRHFERIREISEDMEGAVTEYMATYAEARD